VNSELTRLMPLLAEAVKLLLQLHSTSLEKLVGMQKYMQVATPRAAWV